MQNDAFEQVAEGHVFLFGHCFEDFQDALFHANARLDAFDFDGLTLL